MGGSPRADWQSGGNRSAVQFGYRTVVLRHSRVSLRWQRRAVLMTGLIAAAAVAVTLWTLTAGQYPLTIGEVLLAIIDHPDAGFGRIVVMEWRMPRAVAALTFGAALGVSGAIFQSLTRNPLASPDIIGFSAGSYTGAVAVIVVFAGNYIQVAGGALVGGIGTAAVVYLLAWRRGIQGFRLIVVGIGIGAMLSALSTWMLLKADLEVVAAATAWGAGSLLGTTWPTALISGAVIGVLLLGLSAVGPSLRQLELGDDAAKATGISAEPVRLVSIVIGVALLATVVAAAGPIAFVALAAPQVARRMTRTPGVTLIPSAVTGAFMLAASDLIAQNLFPQSLPAGVITVIVGGTYLIWLIIVEVRRR